MLVYCLLLQERASHTLQLSRTQRSRGVSVKASPLGVEKYSLTTITCQSDGTTWRPGAAPRINNVGSALGGHTQSTTFSDRCIISGTTRCHHVADSHKGIDIVARAPCERKVLQALPIARNGEYTQMLSIDKSHLNAFTPDVPLHQWREQNFSHGLSLIEAKTSQV